MAFSLSFSSSSPSLLNPKLINAAPPLPPYLRSSSVSLRPTIPNNSLLLPLPAPNPRALHLVRASSPQSLPPSPSPSHTTTSTALPTSASSLPLQPHANSSFSQSTPSSHSDNATGAPHSTTTANHNGNEGPGDGAGNGIGNGNGNGNDNGRGSGDDDYDSRDENADDQLGPLLSFEEVLKETKSRGLSLPADMLHAAQNGGIQKLLLLRYFEMQVPTFSSSIFPFLIKVMLLVFN